MLNIVFTVDSSLLREMNFFNIFPTFHVELHSFMDIIILYRFPHNYPLKLFSS